MSEQTPSFSGARPVPMAWQTQAVAGLPLVLAEVGRGGRETEINQQAKDHSVQLVGGGAEHSGMGPDSRLDQRVPGEATVQPGCSLLGSL